MCASPCSKVGEESEERKGGLRNPPLKTYNLFKYKINVKWVGQNSTFCHGILQLNSKILGPFAAADPRRQRVEMVYRFDIHNLRLNLRPSAKSVHAFSPAARTVSEKLQSGVGTLPTVCMVHNAHSRQRDNLSPDPL